MFQVALYHPEIPPNTGNVMRLAANTGFHLHLIEPLGFDMTDARLRRAGMDYRERAMVTVHPTLAAWRSQANPPRTYAFAKRGGTRYTDIVYQAGDALLFGPESTGLPDEVLAGEWVDAILNIPMRPGFRSINLANSVAIAVFEAWRQLGFSDAAPPGI